MLPQDQRVQLRGEPCFSHDFYRLFIADLTCRNGYRLTLALGRHAFNRLRSQILMFYLFVVLFALLRGMRSCHLNHNFLIYAPFATSAAEVNDLW